jgi:hypothetical protein
VSCGYAPLRPEVAFCTSCGAEQPVAGFAGAVAASAAGADGLASGARYRLEFDDGRSVEVGETGLLGRDPAAEADEIVVHLLSLEDPEHSVSKTHLKFGAAADGFWVADRHSTNGTVLVMPDGDRTTLEPGVRTTVPPEAGVEFGNRRVTVAPAPVAKAAR